MEEKSLNPWIESLFAKLGGDREHYLAFAEMAKQLRASYISDKHGDPLMEPAIPFEPEDPNGETIADAFANYFELYWTQYLELLHAGHSRSFTWDCFLERTDREEAMWGAFTKLTKSDAPRMSNPAYAEAYHASIRTGRSPLFAEKFAAFLLEYLQGGERYPILARAREHPLTE